MENSLQKLALCFEVTAMISSICYFYLFPALEFKALMKHGQRTGEAWPPDL